MSTYNKVKCGPVAVDQKGFNSVVERVRSALYRCPTALVIHVKDKGFKVVTKVSANMQNQIDSNKAITVGYYKKGVSVEDLVEDFVFVSDSMAARL